MKRIFLIGCRGAGKTTVAKLLAAKLGWSWRDADQIIQDRFGQSIGDMFSTHGENWFREQEGHILTELCREPNCVIATGGGVVVRPEHRELLRTGRTVWLTADAATLWERLCRDAVTDHQRPDLHQGGLHEIEDILEERTPLYAAWSDLTVNTTDQTPAEVAQTICQRLTPDP